MGRHVPFMKHLGDVNMTYFQHMGRALRLSIRFLLSSAQLIIHALFPFLFINAGKNAVDLYHAQDAL